MEIKSAVDIVNISHFKKALKNGGLHFLQRLYVPSELQDQRITHLASVFAAKEAVMKALSLPLDSWHQIKVAKKRDGAPFVEVLDYKKRIESSSLSMSHDGRYVIAQFVALIKS